MIPIHSKIGQGMRTHFGKLLNEYGKNDFIAVYLENKHFQFLPEPRSEVWRNQQSGCRAVFCEEESTVGKQVWQSSALVSPTTTLNQDAAPIGDDIEPMR